MTAPDIQKQNKFRRILGLVLIAVFMFTVALVFSLAVRVTRGVSRTVETPEYLVRLEVLNGCARAGIAASVADKLSGYKDPRIEVVVIGTGDFDVKKVSRSFIISRDEDKTAAEHLARLLGIEDSQVMYKEMVNNHRQVSVTLVLGEDFADKTLTELSYKE